jgi:hypothetical protein
VKHLMTIGLVLATLTYPVAVQAQKDDFSTKAVADAAVFTLNPAKAYILVEADQASMIAFVRMPSTAEAEEYENDRREELAEKHAKWEKTAGRAQRPEEPTTETFAWPEYGQKHQVLMGSQYRFSKKGVSLYLQEVPAGDYAYYGAVGDIGQGSMFGVCACMGSVAFTAEAGKVTALKFSPPALRLKASRPDLKITNDGFGLPEGMTTMELLAATAASRDSRIPAEKIVEPTYRAVAGFTNWFGVAIDRLTAIDGVFRYERDNIVDLNSAAVVK